MKVKHSNNGVTIIKNDITCLTLILTPFALFWSLPIFTIFYVILDPEKKIGGDITSILPLALIVLIIGSFLCYWVALQWFNRTYIFANNEIITITYKPIPYPLFSDQIIKTYKLEQLHIKKQPKNPNETKSIFVYNLRALMKSGTDKKLVTLSSKNEAFFIKQTLEDNLDIKIKIEQESES